MESRAARVSTSGDGSSGPHHPLTRHASSIRMNVPITGIPSAALVDDLASSELRKMFEVNVLGLFACFALGMAVHSVYQHQRSRRRSGSSLGAEAAALNEGTSSSSGRFFAVRFPPNTEIKSALDSFVKTKNIRAGSIVSCVGSTDTGARLRLANASADFAGSVLETTTKCEIVSFSGTVSSTDGMHVHMSLADDKGAVVGGHLVEARVNTTCELVLVDLQEYAFKRVMDHQTGFKELTVVTDKKGDGRLV